MNIWETHIPAEELSISIMCLCRHESMSESNLTTHEFIMAIYYFCWLGNKCSTQNTHTHTHTHICIYNVIYILAQVAQVVRAFGMNPKVGGSSPPQVETFYVSKTSAPSQEHPFVSRKWMMLPTHTVNISYILYIHMCCVCVYAAFNLSPTCLSFLDKFTGSKNNKTHQPFAVPCTEQYEAILGKCAQ